ncbi:MAG: ABC transporter permease [Planctomycetes bacterium]|nr:ABC transporter permease [Planctomycetota bacterium]
MPPVAFGLAEIHDAEYFRPPTWHASAAISAEGYYERGTRAGNPVQGFTSPPRPVEVRAGEPARNAGSRHPLGTDGLGRDLLARLVWGGRVSLSVGLVSTVLLVLIGIVVGALAGYCGGWVDLLLSRVIEVFQCFPPFFLVLIVVAFIGPGILNIMLVLGLTRWPGVARLVRGEFLRLRGQDFVVAAEALGARHRRTIFRHILPNAMGPVLVAATFSVASGILTESALSFLGFGVKLPVPSWGSLLTESRSPEHWWIQVFPGLMIFVTVVLYNLLGEAVRDALDPRLKT